MTEQIAEQGFNPGVLDLSDADTSAASFEAIPANRYALVVWEAEWTETKEDSKGALGPNFPYINVQLRVHEGDFKNRTVFTKFFPLAPAGYDATKAARNKGTFVNFLVALGFEESEVKNPQFQLDFESWKDKPFVGVVSRDRIPGTEPPDFSNNLKGFKRVGEVSSTDPAAQAASGLL